jgi:two-component system, OmpR family, response regulator
MTTVPVHPSKDLPVAASAGHILLVDDDPGLQVLVARLFQRNGYRVVVAHDGRSMRAAFSRRAFDLVVLDLMLPGENGYDLCKELRGQSDVPVIMLTARGGDSDRVGGFDVGADDYLTKPFNPDELLARVRAVLRRAGGRQQGRLSELGLTDTVTFDGWIFDIRRRELTSPVGALIDLSTGEADLLSVFIDNANIVLSREMLMAAVKTRAMDPLDRTIDVQVSRLRRKLSLGGDESRLIKTMRGAGYVFVPRTGATK